MMVATQKLRIAQEPLNSFQSQLLSFICVSDFEIVGNFEEIRLNLIDVLLIDTLEIGFSEQLTNFFIISGELM